jgi:two-component system, chemotaxis family, sensor kinase CheA
VGAVWVAQSWRPGGGTDDAPAAAAQPAAAPVAPAVDRVPAVPAPAPPASSPPALATPAVAPARALPASTRAKGKRATRYLARGEALLRQDRLVEALNHARAARAAGGGLHARLLLGRILLAMERYEEAAAEYEAALALDPANGIAAAGRDVARARARAE